MDKTGLPNDRNTSRTGRDKLLFSSPALCQAESPRKNIRTPGSTIFTNHCLSAPCSLAQVARKPSGCELGDLFKFSRLLKEVGRPGHALEPLLRPDLLSRLAVNADH